MATPSKKSDKGSSPSSSKEAEGVLQPEDQKTSEEVDSPDHAEERGKKGCDKSGRLRSPREDQTSKSLTKFKSSSSKESTPKKAASKQSRVSSEASGKGLPSSETWKASENLADWKTKSATRRSPLKACSSLGASLFKRSSKTHGSEDGAELPSDSDANVYSSKSIPETGHSADKSVPETRHTADKSVPKTRYAADKFVPETGHTADDKSVLETGHTADDKSVPETEHTRFAEGEHPEGTGTRPKENTGALRRTTGKKGHVTFQLEKDIPSLSSTDTSPRDAVKEQPLTPKKSAESPSKRKGLKWFSDCVSPPKSKSSNDDKKDVADLNFPFGPANEGDMSDQDDNGHQRSPSGSSSFKGLLGGKSKQRNKSVERDDKKDKDKKKSFFDQLRPRSKSDASALARTDKTSPPRDHSIDESTLGACADTARYGSQELTPMIQITPMSQILEGQMLKTRKEERNRHKSGPSGRDGGFMAKFRNRSGSASASSSESKASKSPKKKLQTQKSLSPPSSPRADRSGLSPLKLQSGEPRSAPPGGHGSIFGSDQGGAAAFRPDVNRLNVEPHHMETEECDDNKDLVFTNFMKKYKCYDLIPTSAKLVIFDTKLIVRKAFYALIYNGVRAAPLWDTAIQNYVGMLTITDFIYILKKTYISPNVRMNQLEDQTIEEWRNMIKEKQRQFVSISPDVSLYEAVTTLVDSRVHRLPVIDEASGNAIYILTHKRILRFMHIFIGAAQYPDFMACSIRDLGIGTYTDVKTVKPDTKLIDVLEIFMTHRISALPIVDISGKVINIYAKFDVIKLAAANNYKNLEITVDDALRGVEDSQDESVSTCHQSDTLGAVLQNIVKAGEERVSTCHQSDSLSAVIQKIVKAGVHRLVVVSETNTVEGIISLSDILSFIVRRPTADAAAPVVDQDPLEVPVPLEDPAPLDDPALLEDPAPTQEQGRLGEQAPLAEPDTMVTDAPSVSS